MNVRGKKIIAFVLGACLFFASACSGGQDETAGNETGGAASPKPAASGAAALGSASGEGGQAMGRFVETEYPLPEGAEYIYDIRKLEDGTLRMAAAGDDGLMLFSSPDDGKSWEAMSYEKEKMTGAMIQTACWSPDGGLLVAKMNREEAMQGMAETSYLLYDAKGEGKEFPIQLSDSEGGNGSTGLRAYFDSDGSLYLSGGGSSIHRIDLSSGAIQKTYSNPDAATARFGIVGQTLWINTGSGVECYELESGKSLERQEALNEYIKAYIAKNPSAADGAGVFSSVPVASGLKGNDLYFCDDTGLYHYTMGGSVVEQVIDGSLNSLSAATVYQTGVFPLSDQSFLVAVTDNGEAKLLGYHYDSSVPTVPNTELTVYALQDTQNIRQAVRLYQHDHPDVYITLEIGMSGEDGITSADAIRTLNTNLMAGKGPDILVLDGMTISNYVEKGMLLDISDILQEIEASDGLFENLVHAYQKDGQTTAVPVRVMLPMVLGDAESLKKITDLKSLAECAETLRQQNPDVDGILGAETAELLMKKLYGSSSAAWLKDGKLDQAALEEFISCIKRIYLADQRQSTSENHGEVAIVGGGGTLPLSDNMDLFSYLGGYNLLSVGQLDSFQSLAILTSFEEQMGSSYQAFSGQLKGVFQPVLTVGVNAKGSQSETAKDFVRYLLGKEAQSNDSLEGLPVNRAAFEAAKQSMFPEGKRQVMSSGEIDAMKEVEIHWPKEAALSGLKEMMEAASIPADSNQVIRDAVEEEVKRLLEGASTEDVVQSVMQKVNLYLSEQ
ncbi:extracellular solute-binding protein [Hominifimenecus sp. rT4P-3]|uniref:extracellular solute-binding protein n=1 Tax=Hominifimenecus sp. rT4P-3 TaxID=3242979 RepID=UPI003DA4C085